MPHAVADALRERGVDVLTAVEAGLRSQPDESYALLALSEDRVIVTRDEDFFTVLRERNHAGMVYCTPRCSSVGQILAGLLRVHGALEAEDMRSTVQYI
jgi:uncharacterized protein with PIN domain